MPATISRPAPADVASSRDGRIESRLSLVYHVARQLSRSLSARVEFDELVSFGTVGLIDAVNAFDASRGLAFSTFAVPRIRGAILDALRRQDHVPRSVRRKARALSAAREAISGTTGRAPRDREIAEHLGVDTATVWRWESDAAAATMISIDAGPEEGDGPRSFAELFASTAATIEDELTREQEIGFMINAIRELNTQERTVLALYYHEELKMHEIAAALHVTESRVSQIRSRALARLRVAMAPLRGLTEVA